MKKYQVKFIATNESPILGTDQIITTKGEITTLAEHLAKPDALDEGYFLMRPFLTDRPSSIKPGDYVISGSKETGYYEGFEDGVHSFKNSLDSEDTSGWSCDNNYFLSHVLKIVGEVSPLANWVKEGDEFTAESEDNDSLEIAPFHTHDDDGNIIYVDVANHVVTRPVYRVRCSNCKRFH